MTAADKQAEEHLAFLWPSLQTRDDVVVAKDLCTNMDDGALGHLLRHHDHEEIAGRAEINSRQVFDNALQSYSLLTVAVIAGYVPVNLSPDIRQDIESFLGREPVRLYYEKHYPVFLPSLLRLHATGAIRLPRDGSDPAWGSFQWFVRFSGRFEKDRNLEAFLRLLDGFHYGEFNIESFLNDLRNPAKELLEGLSKPPDLLTRRDSSVLGMLRFMTFCREFAPALEAMESAPLTQSACWFYYAYWFKGFVEDVGSRVEECLSVLDLWLKSDKLGMTAAADAERTVSDVRLAIVALVDGRYAAPLVNRLK